MKIRVKLAIIALLLVVMAAPLLLVVSKIYERGAFREQARADIARSWTGEQVVLGPVLFIPYTRVETTRVVDESRGNHVMRETEVQSWLLVVPERLDIASRLDTEVRYRGIYEIPVYTSRTRFTGVFPTEPLAALATQDGVRRIGQPVLSLAVSDTRGIAKPPVLEWEGATLDFEPGSALPFRPAGIHVPVPGLDGMSGVHRSFSVELELRGMSSFGVVPAGDATAVSMRSGWPHPRFEGMYLPAEREIGDDGFVATWRTSRFSTNVKDQADACSSGDCTPLSTNYLGVALVEPVDIYMQAQRATKYGMLFIGLTFTAFFLFEVMKKLAIHPIQYGLVGLALAVFFLLLISLAEHVRFGLAYTVAATTCCLLLWFYVTYVLGSFLRSSLFAAGVGLLYAVLYVIIRAEDYAFSMGAALVFLALATVMITTRSIDWYALSQDRARDP